MRHEKRIEFLVETDDLAVIYKSISIATIVVEVVKFRGLSTRTDY